MFNSLVSPSHRIAAFSLALPVATGLWAYAIAAAQEQPPLPKAPFSDYRTEKPGTMHRIAPADLPAPLATPPSANPPKVVPRPQGAMPQTMPGYSVSLYSSELQAPRLI